MSANSQLSPQDFAAKIRAKYPKVYDDIDDVVLTRRILSKYPTYRDMVALPDVDKPIDEQTVLNEAQRFGLKVTSGYRSPARNRAVGGAENSFHLQGQAFDLAGPSEQMKRFYDHMRDNFGGRIPEIIHGTGDHQDHVHIAFEKGAEQPAPVVDESASFEVPSLPETPAQVVSLATNVDAKTAEEFVNSPQAKKVEQLIQPPRSVMLQGIDPNNLPGLEQLAQMVLTHPDIGFSPESAKGQKFEFRIPQESIFEKLTPEGKLPVDIPEEEFQYLQKQAHPVTDEQVENRYLNEFIRHFFAPTPDMVLSDPLVEKVTRPIRAASTAVAGLQRNIGAQLGWAAAKLTGDEENAKTYSQALDEYGADDLLSAAWETLSTGKVRPGFEQPVGELFKVAVESSGGDMEKGYNQLAHFLLSNVSDLTNLIPVLGGSKFKAKVAGALPEPKASPSITPVIREIKPKGDTINAKAIRINEGQVQERGIVGQGGAAKGGQDLQLEAPEKPGNAQVAQEQVAPPKSVVRVSHENPAIDGDVVVGKTADGTKLKVQGDDGVTHIIQHPRRGGNQVASLKRETVTQELVATKERATPKTLQEAGLEGGQNRTYEATTNAESVAAAERIIQEKGVDGAVEYVRTAKEPGAENTATAITLLRRLQDEGTALAATDAQTSARRFQQAIDVASDLSERLTKQGQAIQAVKIVNQLSPERALLVAERIAKKRGKSLTAEQAAEFTDLATRAQRAEARVTDLERNIERLRGAKRKPQAGGLRDRLQAEADAALARIRERQSQSEAGFIGSREVKGKLPGLSEELKDYAIYGASKLAVKGLDLATWTAEMVKEFGESIKDRLPQIRQESYRYYQEQRQADLLARAKDPVTSKSALAEIGEEIRQLKQAESEAARIAGRVNKYSKKIFDEPLDKQLKRQLREAQKLYFKAASLERQSRRAANLEAKKQQRNLTPEEQNLLTDLSRATEEALEAKTGLAKNLTAIGTSRGKRVVNEVSNLPHAIQTSIDAPTGRQGLFYLLTHPVVSLKGSIPETAKSYFRSKKSYSEAVKELEARPTYDMWTEMGLERTGLPSEVSLSRAEEPFQSVIGERIPVIRHSNQAYSLGMNTLRQDIADLYDVILRAEGKTPSTDPAAFQLAARRANVMTGRGWLPKRIESSSQIINWFFRAPRFLASKVEQLSSLLNPVEYARVYKTSPGLFRTVVRENVTFMAELGLGLTALNWLSEQRPDLGIKVTFDPDDGDFGKVAIGNLHIDVTGGTGGVVRHFFRMARDLFGESDGTEKQKFLTVLQELAEPKLAPVPSAVLNTARGYDYLKEPTSAVKEGRKLVTPFLGNEFYETATEHGTLAALLALPSSLAGFSTSTYKTRPEQSAATKLARNLRAERMPDKAPTPEEHEKREKKRKIVEAARGGDLSPALKALGRKEIDANEFLEIKRGAKRSELENAFEDLSIKDALTVWDVATDEEKKQLKPLMTKKYLSSLPRLSASERKEITERFKKAMGK